MNFPEKLGYAVLAYWGYKVARKIHRTYKIHFSHSPGLDLISLGSWGVVTCCPNLIGNAYAKSLASRGFNLVLVGTSSEKIQVFAEDLESKFKIQTKTIELGIFSGPEIYEAMEKELLSLDIGILVNTLSLSYPHPEYFLDLPYKEKIYANIIQCNVVVTTNMSKIILPGMLERGKGVVINMASSTAIMPSPLLTVFAATKAYVLKFTEDLGAEYRKHGIVFQCLLPGSVTSQPSKCSPGSWVSPTPETYVESAIRTIGKSDVTTGYFLHSLFVGFFELLQKCSPGIVVRIMTKVMESNRNCALRRYVG